jgi:hypothetical protein
VRGPAIQRQGRGVADQDAVIRAESELRPREFDVAGDPETFVAKRWWYATAAKALAARLDGVETRHPFEIATTVGFDHVA